MSTQRREFATSKGRGPNGRFLCWCGCGREVSPPRRHWFSAACVDEWKGRNDLAYIRAKVFERDKGICAKCGIDCQAAYAKALDEKSILPGFPNDFGRDWWEADHIVPVIRGGGQCGLDGYRTLCVPCHKGETAKLARERMTERRREKERQSPQTGFFPVLDGQPTTHNPQPA